MFPEGLVHASNTAYTVEASQIQSCYLYPDKQLNDGDERTMMWCFNAPSSERRLCPARLICIAVLNYITMAVRVPHAAASFT